MKRKQHKKKVPRGNATPPATSIAGMWTRGDVANVLRTSKRTVQRLEERGLLRAVVAADGTHWFAPADVRAIRDQKQQPRETPEGELAAAVFERFQNAKSLAAIVLELKIAPRVVKSLYLEWRTDLEAFASSVEE